MPPRRRRIPLNAVPEYVPAPLRLADSRPQAPSSDPTMGYGWSGWDQPSKPLTSAQKTQLYGATGTQIFAGLFADDQYGILDPPEWRNTERWKTIAKMRRDGQASAVRNVCLLPLVQASISINPASESDQDVQIAQELSDNLLHGMQGGWPEFIRKFFNNRFENGHYAGEKVWTPTADGWRLRKIAERPAETIYRWFQNSDDVLDRIMQRVWVQNENGVNGQWKFPIVSAEKLMLSTRNQRANDYRGVSIYYPMWEHWLYKRGLYKIDAVAAERNGMGVPGVEEPPVVRQQSDRILAQQMLEGFRVGEYAYVDLPAGWKFNLTGVTGQVRDIQPSIQHHDLMMARSALAHFLNLDSYGQVLISEESQSLFLMAEESDAAEACEPLNWLAREWVDANYENVDRYPTFAITGISGQRDLDAVLKAVSALFTSKVLTYNVETENAIRDDLDLPELPAAATAAGGGAVSVDTESQGPEAAPPSDDPGQVQQNARPGATAQQDLSFRPAFSAGRLNGRAIQLSGRPLRDHRFTTHLSGAYGRPVGRETIETDADGTQWLCLARPVKVGGKSVPNPNTGDYGSPPDDADEMLGRGYTHVVWQLGDGGKSGKHCPQCVYMARQGLMRIQDLKISPASGGTFCEDDCTCTLSYRRAKNVGVGLPAQGTTKR